MKTLPKTKLSDIDAAGRKKIEELRLASSDGSFLRPRFSPDGIAFDREGPPLDGVHIKVLQEADGVHLQVSVIAEGSERMLGGKPMKTDALKVNDTIHVRLGDKLTCTP